MICCHSPAAMRRRMRWSKLSRHRGTPAVVAGPQPRHRAGAGGTALTWSAAALLVALVVTFVLGGTPGVAAADATAAAAGAPDHNASAQHGPTDGQLRRQEEALLRLARTTAASVGVEFAPVKKAHLIRVPKAGSSLLSAVARRLAGCTPAGPCCRYPGSPPGSCPAVSDPPKGSDLMCDNVVGCTGHNPHLEALRDSTIVSISMMREPVRRALSAFAYVPPHTNRVGACQGSFSRECFLKFVKAHKYENVATKMFSGNTAYTCGSNCTAKRSSSSSSSSSSKKHTCDCSLEAAQETAEKLDFLGVTELWDLSMLVLYHKVPQFEPSEGDFKLFAYEGGGSVADDAAAAGAEESEEAVQLGSRADTSAAYTAFKATAPTAYAAELAYQNRWDIELYRVAVRQLCDALHDAGFWEHSAVRMSWAQNAPAGYEDAAPACRASGAN